MKITEIEIEESFSSTKGSYEATVKMSGKLCDLIDIIHAITSDEPPELSHEDEEE